jgi:hypothetical protein
LRNGLRRGAGEIAGGRSARCRPRPWRTARLCRAADRRSRAGIWLLLAARPAPPSAEIVR